MFKNNALLVSVAIMVISSVFAAGGYHDSSVAEIVNFENYNAGENGYRYQFDTSDGTSRVEAGEIKDLGFQSERLAVQGSYIYVDDSGREQAVEYTAGEGGYRAKVRFGTKLSS